MACRTLHVYPCPLCVASHDHILLTCIIDVHAALVRADSRVVSGSPFGDLVIPSAGGGSDGEDSCQDTSLLGKPAHLRKTRFCQVGQLAVKATAIDHILLAMLLLAACKPFRDMSHTSWLSLAQALGCTVELSKTGRAYCIKRGLCPEHMKVAFLPAGCFLKHS